MITREVDVLFVGMGLHRKVTQEFIQVQSIGNAKLMRRVGTMRVRRAASRCSSLPTSL